MDTSEATRTIADTIVWMAEKIQKSKTPCQNLVSAIQSVNMDVGVELMKYMNKANEEMKNKCKLINGD